MIQSQKLIVTVLVVFNIFTVYCFDCSAGEDRVSHFEAALELFTTVKEKITTIYIDSIVEYILIQEPEYKNDRKKIYSMIQNFILSEEFKELWLNALIYFFPENEIREITLKLKNPNYSNSSEYQSTLIKKYEYIFNSLKKKFIERVQFKLKRIMEKEK
ncbi:MAG: hypothetical protein PVI26_09685 [Chitinispirillia bacterium]|jgi:hypothetical protein